MRRKKKKNIIKPKEMMAFIEEFKNICHIEPFPILNYDKEKSRLELKVDEIFLFKLKQKYGEGIDYEKTFVEFLYDYLNRDVRREYGVEDE